MRGRRFLPPEVPPPTLSQPLSYTLSHITTTRLLTGWLCFTSEAVGVRLRDYPELAPHVFLFIPPVGGGGLVNQ